MPQCDHHDELIVSLEKVATNVAWLANIGKWFLTVTGALVTFVVPMLIALGIHIVNMDKKIAINTLSINATEQKLQEHCNKENKK